MFDDDMTVYEVENDERNDVVVFVYERRVDAELRAAEIGSVVIERPLFAFLHATREMGQMLYIYRADGTIALL